MGHLKVGDRQWINKFQKLRNAIKEIKKIKEGELLRLGKKTLLKGRMPELS